MGIFDMFSNANEKKGRNAQNAGLDAGRRTAYNFLDKGLAGATAGYDTADSYYKPLYDRYNAGSQLYSDALGVIGAAGNAHAVDAFHAGPGYQWEQEQAAQAALRSGSAAGRLGSGNTAIAIQDRAGEIANNEYSGWLNDLSGYDPLVMGAAGARSGIATGRGGAINDTNVNKAQVGWATETGKGQANAQYQFGKDQTSANIWGAVGGGLKLASAFL